MEILFRGFHPDGHGGQTIVVGGKKVKGEWRQGCFFQIWEHTYILWGTTNGVPSMAEVIPSTVGQFSGKKDANGKRIFLGDIIAESWGDPLETHKAKVIWEGNGFYADGDFGVNISEFSEVIGTIYDEGALNEMP